MSEAVRTCSYCGNPEGNGHSRRCSVVVFDAKEVWVEPDPRSTQAVRQCDHKDWMRTMDRVRKCRTCGTYLPEEPCPTKPLPDRAGVLRRKLGVARGMLISARGVIEGRLPKDDCTPEEITQALDETLDDGDEWAEACMDKPEVASGEAGVYERALLAILSRYEQNPTMHGRETTLLVREALAFGRGLRTDYARSALEARVHGSRFCGYYVSLHGLPDEVGITLRTELAEAAADAFAAKVNAALVPQRSETARKP